MNTISPIILDRLNSLTKYPSILTFHKLGEKGRLLDELSFPLPEENEPLFVTEKVDGTNGRVIILPDGDYFIGSREELLYAKGDRIGNPMMGIVDALRPVAENIVPKLVLRFGLPLVVFGEVFGAGKGAAAKNYAKKYVGFRCFDIMLLDNTLLRNMLDKPKEEIASWRDAGNQPFMRENELIETCKAIDLPSVPKIECPCPPIEIEKTAEWLKEVSFTTRVALDADSGLSEGVVIRNRNRSFIVKIRHEDYERTLRARKGK